MRAVANAIVNVIYLYYVQRLAGMGICISASTQILGRRKKAAAARRQRKWYSARKAQIDFEKKERELLWGKINGKRRTCARANQCSRLRFYPKISFAASRLVAFFVTEFPHYYKKNSCNLDKKMKA